MEDNTMKKLLKVLITTGLITALLALSACGDTSQGNSSSDNKDGTPRTIKVAVAPGFYPITYADEQGNPDGYDVAVLKAVDELLEDYNFTFELADKETMNVGVQTGTYQVGINSLFKTDARLETYLMPENNLGNTAVGIIYRESDEKISNFQDVYDRHLKIHPTQAAGSIKSVIQTWNESHPDAKLEIELTSGATSAESVASVKAGEYDVTVDLIPVFNLFDDESRKGLTVSDPVEVVPTYAIINKEEKELNAAIDKALGELKESGKLSEISNQYFGYDVFNIQ